MDMTPLYRAAEAATADQRLHWLAAARAAALERIEAIGFPTVADERWRYTSIGPAIATTLERAGISVPLDPEMARLATAAGVLRLPMAACFFMLGGELQPSLGTAPSPVFGGRAVSFRDPAAQPAAAASTVFSAACLALDSALPSLNTALLRDGLYIEIAPLAHIEQPVYIVMHEHGTGQSQNRLVVSLGAGSRATLIIHQLGEGFSNTVCDIHCDARSSLSLARLQTAADAATCLGTQRLRLEAAAEAHVFQLDSGSALTRNELRVALAGSGSAATIHGLFMADGARHLDNQVRVDHLGTKTVSRETVRGIADNHGRGIFNGSIVVHPGAAGADAKLTNQNLLLAETAEIDTKPELEINADDVKCAHGSTTGQLDSNALYYLRSRGIPADEARRILIGAFARDIIASAPGKDLASAIAALLGESRPVWRDLWNNA